MTPVLELRSVSKSFADASGGTPNPVIKNISFTVPKGTLLALVGPNGSGKSTLLRLVAGLDQPNSGEIVRHPGYEGLSVEFMFQDFRSTFFPWCSLARNVAFPFRNSEKNGTLAIETLRGLISDNALSAFPRTLSGGELQAAAFARSISRSVDLLLLDEPFGSMDLTVRSRAIAACRAGLASGRIGAAILVTHNLEDVATLAQKVLVLRSHPGTLACELELSVALESSGPENSAAALQLLKSKVQEALRQ